MKAMILAAGLGTRLRPYTNYMPKPVLPFLNVPLLYYPSFLLECGGVSELVVNTHHLPAQVSQLALGIPGFKDRVHISHEDGAPLGGGGGIWHARKHFESEENFFVANGDEVILPKDWQILRKVQSKHAETKALATIVVMHHPGVGTQFGGVWADADGLVRGFGKQSPDPGARLRGHHFIGIILLHNRVLSYLPAGESNILYDVLLSAIGKGEKVMVFEDDCRWFETGNPEDFFAASNSCLRSELRQTPEKSPFLPLFKRYWPEFAARPSLWVGQNCNLQGTLSDGAVLLAGDDCRVGKDSKITGFTILGAGARVGARCELENVVILPGAKLRDGAAIRDRIILPRAER